MSLMPPTEVPIVVADDNDDDVFMLHRLLRKAGVANRLVVHSSSAEALAYFGRIAAQQVDLPLACFLDIKLPGRDGFEVLKTIRAEPRLLRLPVVMLSSSDERRDIARASTLGAQCYLRKYPTPQALAAALQRGAEYAAHSERSSAFEDVPGNLLTR